jgi:PAS domain S-box-containing protein
MRRTHAPADRAKTTSSATRPGGSADPAQAPVPAPALANERFRLLFDRASVGIVILGPHGRAVEANPGVERMLGYSAAELAELSFGSFTHPDDMEQSARLYRELLEHQRESYEHEKRYIRKDGEEIWARVPCGGIRPRRRIGSSSR